MPENNLKKELLDRLASAQSIVQMIVQSEAQRMAAKHGAASHKTLQMHQKARGAASLLNGIEIASQVYTEPVQPQGGETVIYGRVISGNLRGLSRLRVALVTPDGKPVITSDTTTDASGKYSLHVPPALIGKYQDILLTISVLDENNQVLKREKNPIHLQEKKLLRVDAVIPALESRKAGESRPSGTPDEKTAPDFAVHGTVQNAAGKPVGRVMVLLYHGDVQNETLLGAQLTGRKGEFTLTYTYPDYREDEADTDIYFIVHDLQGKELYSSMHHLRFDPNHHASITITLPE
ncbi:MAG: hypothetical protein ACOX5R_19150 [bacterium]|jgi:protocatechuate 3,4-dioxygenase beta subunit